MNIQAKRLGNKWVILVDDGMVQKVFADKTEATYWIENGKICDNGTRYLLGAGTVAIIKLNVLAAFAAMK